MTRRRSHPYNMHPYLSKPQEQRGRREEQPDKEESVPAEEPMEDLERTPPEKDETSGEEQGQPPVQESQEALLEEKLKDERMRMAAEMDNYKKRLQREHQEQIRYAGEKVLSSLLPALDNLDLALQYGSQNEACKDMIQGIEMTRKQLLEAVAKSGLIPLGEKGEPFDPAIHEAIGIFPDDSLEKGAVSQVMQRGYKLNDRTLRPAKVMVNN